MEALASIREYLNNVVHSSCDYNIYLELWYMVDEIEKELIKMMLRDLPMEPPIEEPIYEILCKCAECGEPIYDDPNSCYYELGGNHYCESCIKEAKHWC